MSMEDDHGYGRTTTSNSRMPDASSALAQKLLQGWALLDEHCPQCLTPLVRNRQRKMFCVACDQWVATQSEVAEQLLRERVEEATKSEPSTLPEPVSGPPNSDSQELSNPANNQNIIAESRPIETGRTTDRALQSHAQNGDALIRSDAIENGRNMSSGSGLRLPKLNAYSKTFEDVVPNILAVLVQKLEEIGMSLSASQNVDDVRALLSALRECLQAIADVKASGRIE